MNIANGTEKPASWREVPMPRGHWLLKNLPDVQNDDQLDNYLRWQREYGDFLRIEAFGTRWFLVNDPAEIEPFLRGSYHTYHKGNFWNRVRRVLGNGLLTNDGELWRGHRRALQPAFHPNFHASYVETMSRATAQMLERFAARANESFGESFDILDEMSRITIVNAGLTLFSEDFSALYDRMGADLHYIVSKMNVRNFGVSFTVNPSLRAALKKLHVIIDEIIARRRAKIAAGADDAPDMLSALLNARDPKTGESFTDSELHDEILTFIFVGHETTALSLAWTFYLLAKNPDCEALAVAEARAQVQGAAPTLDELGRLPYTKNVFLETLRLYPPVWGLARQTTKEVEVRGVTLPAKSIVIAIPYLTHRHPDFWPDPETFDPTRFEPAIEKTRPRYAYYPFGGGPRLCIGMGFAMLEAQIILAAVLKRYRLELLPNQNIEIALWATLRPRHGIKMRLHAR